MIETEIKLRPYKILWIDDMLQWAKSAQYLLEELVGDLSVDLHYVSKANGEDIKWSATVFDFDLIVMDYHMEPFTGDKYINDIREEEHLENTPIIFYTQDPTASLAGKIIRVNNVHCVYRTELLDTIIRFIAGKS